MAENRPKYQTLNLKAKDLKNWPNLSDLVFKKINTVIVLYEYINNTVF